jgi:hypothetical protein
MCLVHTLLSRNLPMLKGAYNSRGIFVQTSSSTFRTVSPCCQDLQGNAKNSHPYKIKPIY